MTDIDGSRGSYTAHGMAADGQMTSDGRSDLVSRAAGADVMGLVGLDRSQPRFVETGDNDAGGAAVEAEIKKVMLCFTPGTRIATQRGEVDVQRLKAGDAVLTRDNGTQELRWVGHRALDASDLTQAA